ncbi:MAG: histidine phosphatase family protein [Sneathiella sp.]
MIPILLIRHGKTSWNAAKKLQGRRDIPLSDAGRQLLEKNVIPDEFLNFKWVSSPLIRAQETAKILGAKDPDIEDLLVEMDWGEWEGRTIGELRRELGPAMKGIEDKGLHMKPPEGESPAEVQDRIRQWLETIKEPTVAVTHKGVIRAFKSLAYNWDMTDKSPVTFNWNCAHLFEVDEQGQVFPVRVNINLERQ